MIGLNGKRLSASSVERAIDCAYSWTSDLVWQDTPIPSAKLGSALHAHAEDRIEQPWAARSLNALEREFKLAPAQKRDLATMTKSFDRWFDKQPEFEHARAERKIYFDPEAGTARMVATPGHRDYSAATDDEIAGTVDVWIPGETPIVVDWKTGGYVAHPAESWQQKTYALGGMLFSGAKSVEARIVRIQAKDPEPVVLRAPFVEAHLLPLRDTLVQLRSKIRDGSQRPNPSASACRFCPVKKTCAEAYRKEAV